MTANCPSIGLFVPAHENTQTFSPRPQPEHFVIKQRLTTIQVSIRPHSLHSPRPQSAPHSKHTISSDTMLKTFQEMTLNSASLKRKIEQPALSKVPPFLRLPAELRNRIYELTVVDLSRVISVVDDFPYRKNIKAEVAQPPITKVCRQLRTESLPVFYGANVFKIEAQSRFRNALVPNRAIAWLRAIGAANRSRLKHLYVDYNEGMMWETLFFAVSESVSVKAVALHH